MWFECVTDGSAIDASVHSETGQQVSTGIDGTVNKTAAEWLRQKSTLGENIALSLTLCQSVTLL